MASGPGRGLRVTVSKEEKVTVVKISDWMPMNEPPTNLYRSPSLGQISTNNAQLNSSTSTSDCEFHFNVEVAELGLSLVDHTPEEILYLSLQGFLLSYSTGLGSGISR